MRQCALILAVPILLQSLLPAAPPSVERIFPITGQRGTRFELTMAGSGLDRAESIVFYRPGIRFVEIQAESPNQAKVILESTSDCDLGSHPFRVYSNDGFSDLRTVRMTSLPIVVETEDNSDFDAAQPVSLNCTVAGVVEAGDSDYFRCSLRQGQRLSVEVEAIRTGAAMFDAVLNLYGPDGTWLYSADDAAQTQQDPFLTFRAPSDGEYVIQIHESAFEGDENSCYALHIGEFARPTWVYPAGAEAGSSVALEFGDSLNELTSISKSIPQTTVAMSEIECGGADSNSPVRLPFRISSFPNQMEIEPNNQLNATTPEAVNLPVALNGRLQNPGDIDVFPIRAHQGDVMNFEVFSARIGSPADTILTVSDKSGKILGRSDDGLSHDSQLTLQFPADDVFFVSVSDKRENGGDEFIYRVEISPYKPQLTAFLSRPDRRSQDYQTIAVPRGNRVLTWLACQKTGFTADVQLMCSGLPEGVSVSECVIPADRFWMPMILEANESSGNIGTLVDVTASAELHSQSIHGNFRQIVDLVAASADQLYQAAEVDRLAVAVVDPVDFQIELVPPTTPLSPDGTLDLKVMIHRRNGFSEPVTISAPFLPPWVDAPASVNAGPDQTMVMFPLRAWSQAEPRDWSFCLEAKARIVAKEASASVANEAGSTGMAEPGRQGRGQRRRDASVRTAAVASQLVELKIATSPVSGTLPAHVMSPGTESRLICRFERGNDLPADLTATLEGLPNRVTAVPVKVSAIDSTAAFRIVAEDSAPLGTFSGLSVRFSGIRDDHSVSWKVGSGGTLRLVRADELVPGADGQPLSRLDILRSRAKSNAGSSASENSKSEDSDSTEIPLP
ncbi:MAG: PPC domain-containing protein [Planctomyces sp.]|nr:PPC domain-containing protein [Planctomyces sp.]